MKKRNIHFGYHYTSGSKGFGFSRAAFVVTGPVTPELISKVEKELKEHLNSEGKNVDSVVISFWQAFEE
jgi:hypothetical protein